MVGLSTYHKIAGIITENMLGHLYNDFQYWGKKVVPWGYVNYSFLV